METVKQQKRQYASPGTEVLELRNEGVICASVDPTVTNPFEGLQETEL